MSAPGSQRTRAATALSDGQSVVLSRQLSPELRVMLDVIRVLAAGYVVLHHIAIRSDPGAIEPLLRFGQEAVMAFFLLSGFVIHANERHRAPGDQRGYLLRRGLRIYPTLIIAMGVSFAVAAAQGQLGERFDAGEAMCTLFALQDAAALKPGTICRPFMGNSPLWSLSYEVVFYLLYPLVLPLFLRRPRVLQHVLGLATLALIVAYVARPTHFLLLPAYFLIWWCGAMMAERCLNPHAARGMIRWPMFYLALAVLGWAAAAATQGIDRIGTYPMLMLRHYGVALLLLGVAMSPLAGWAVARMGGRGARAWGWASSVSYGVYVIHFPLLIQWQLAASWTGFALACVVVLIISDLADRQMNRLVRGFLRRPQKETA